MLATHGQKRQISGLPAPKRSGGPRENSTIIRKTALVNAWSRQLHAILRTPPSTPVLQPLPAPTQTIPTLEQEDQEIKALDELIKEVIEEELPEDQAAEGYSNEIETVRFLSSDYFLFVDQQQ